jgi:hypothetical protein
MPAFTRTLVSDYIRQSKFICKVSSAKSIQNSPRSFPKLQERQVNTQVRVHYEGMRLAFGGSRAIYLPLTANPETWPLLDNKPWNVANHLKW